ncbi:Rieske (2Fe-2S) protein [Microvirga sesbaniae]|uniref:Rieske (2Fe-2S) protein n=1 Tax=Microvirga sesbaniae TaxID=681392 RepID=UPI0021C84639|nr:Rieske (2Fe-2S) protein [Microvirga sp. HBU67692]
MSKHVVAPVTEFLDGTHRLVHINGRTIAVFNIDGEFFGIANACPHQGGSLCDGHLGSLVTSDSPGQYRLERKGEILRCPWHGWEFDIRSGQSWCDPKRIRTRSYQVDVKEGFELVKGPYVADTFTVSVEDRYVVIEA